MSKHRCASSRACAHLRSSLSPSFHCPLPSTPLLSCPPQPPFPSRINGHPGNLVLLAGQWKLEEVSLSCMQCR